MKPTMKQTVVAALLGLSLFTTTSAEAKQFNDVPKNASYYESINVLSDLGVIGGYTEKGVSIFKPHNNLTRGQASKILIGTLEQAGVPLTKVRNPKTFADVPMSNGFIAYVEKMYAYGIADGYNNGTFGVNNALTRGQVAKIVANAFGITAQGTYQPYADVQGLAVEPYVRALHENGIVTFNNNFRPNQRATRAEFTEQVYRAMLWVESNSSNSNLVEETPTVTPQPTPTPTPQPSTPPVVDNGNNNQVVTPPTTTTANYTIDNGKTKIQLDFDKTQPKSANANINTGILPYRIETDMKRFTSWNRNKQELSSQLRNYDGSLIDSNHTPYRLMSRDAGDYLIPMVDDTVTGYGLYNRVSERYKEIGEYLIGYVGTFEKNVVIGGGRSNALHLTNSCSIITYLDDTKIDRNRYTPKLSFRTVEDSSYARKSWDITVVETDLEYALNDVYSGTPCHINGQRTANDTSQHIRYDAVENKLVFLPTENVYLQRPPTDVAMPTHLVEAYTNLRKQIGIINGQDVVKQDVFILYKFLMEYKDTLLFGTPMDFKKYVPTVSESQRWFNPRNHPIPNR